MTGLSTDIPTKINKHGERLHYSLVLKESQSKLRFNERLFILAEEKYFGYIKQYDKKNLEMSCDADKIKKKIFLKDIRKVTEIEDQIAIQMIQYEKGNKQKSLKWVFKMPNPQVASYWVELIEKQNSPFPSRKTTEQKEREVEPSPDKSLTKSPSINELPLSSQINKKKDDSIMRSKTNSIDNRIKQVSKELFGNQNLRGSQVPKRTFSFRDQKQQENIEIINLGNKPNPILEKARKIQTNLSSHLESKVNFNVINAELSQLQEQYKSKSRGEFRQLSESLTNRQKQIQNLNFLNYFRQRPGEIDDKRYQDFFFFCEVKMKELLLQNFQDQVSTKRWQQSVETRNGVKVTILLTELKQIPGNSNICDEGLLKSYLNKVKNLDFLWKVISGHDSLSEVFKVPMSCMVEFQGVIAFFTCLFPSFSQPYAVSKNQDFSTLFETLAIETKINKITFENSNSIKFVKISHREFAISSVGQFLPRLSSTGNVIRPELFSQIEWKTGQDYFVKMGKKQQEQQNRYFKKPINEAIITLAKNLNKLEEYVVHPNQFSPLLHLYGLNISNMSQIYKKVDNIFIKGIIKTQAALRSFKTVYRKKMQEFLISIADKQVSQERNEFILAALSKSMLNILLGKSQAGSVLWEMVTLHSQINFKMAVSREQVNKGYFLLGLQHHLGMNIQVSQDQCSKMFEIDSFVSSVEFVAKMKSCKVFWIKDQIGSLPLNKVAEDLIKKLNLKDKNIPFYIYQDRNTASKIFDILSHYNPPNSSSLKHLRIYKDLDQNTDISFFSCQRKMTEIKWTIKAEAQASSTIGVSGIEEKLMKLKAQINFYFGHFHPFYTEIYDLLISLYERQGNFDKVQHYLKSSMTNIIQLCGGNTMHLRLANNYYQKGEFLQNWGHSEEAIASFKKAKNILQFNEYTKARQYAVIQLKLAALYLSKQKDNDCYKLLGSCLSTFCKMANIKIEMIPKYSSSLIHQEIQQIQQAQMEQQTQTYNNIVECLQLMNRCTLSGLPDRSSTILETSLVILTACIEPNNPNYANCFQDILAIRLIKLSIQNYLYQHHKQINEQIINLVNFLGDEIHVGNPRALDPVNSLLLIKQFIINNIFISTLDNFAKKAKECNKKVKQNPILSKTMPSKEIQNFYQLIRSILIVVGEGFLQGILNDSYH